MLVAVGRIFFTAFSLFSMWMASGFGALFMNGFTPVMFYIVPFILIGFYMLFSPFMAKKAALKTIYIITDRRAILFEGHSPMTIRSYLPNQLQNVYRQENKNGLGNVMINLRSVRDSESGERTKSIGFMNIRDPKGVEKFLRELADINI